MGRLALVLIPLILLIGCGGGVNEEVAVMETTHGTVVLGFFPDAAPQHVENFKRLAREGVYDGVLFHRVIPGFVVQGGDPGTKDKATPRTHYGTGGTGNSVPLEVNEHKHVRGALGMARAQDPNSADSQFYIALQDLPQLDSGYTVFGEVLSGMAAVDSIAASETDVRDIPVEDARITTVRIVPRKEAGLE